VTNLLLGMTCQEIFEEVRVVEGRVPFLFWCELSSQFPEECSISNFDFRFKKIPKNPGTEPKNENTVVMDCTDRTCPYISIFLRGKKPAHRVKNAEKPTVFSAKKMYFF
jgi:hypothetical protein